MKLLIIFSLLFLSSCSYKNSSDRRLHQVVKEFSGHLYIHYSRYSKRPRRDNTGKFKDTWPLNPRAHDPHDKPGVKPMRME